MPGNDHRYRCHSTGDWTEYRFFCESRISVYVDSNRDIQVLVTNQPGARYVNKQISSTKKLLELASSYTVSSAVVIDKRPVFRATAAVHDFGKILNRKVATTSKMNMDPTANARVRKTVRPVRRALRLPLLPCICRCLRVRPQYHLLWHQRWQFVSRWR